MATTTESKPPSSLPKEPPSLDPALEGALLTLGRLLLTIAQTPRQEESSAAAA